MGFMVISFYKEVSSRLNCETFFKYGYVRTHIHIKSYLKNGSQFKRELTSLLKEITINPICTSINDPQSNVLVERIHQVI